MEMKILLVDLEACGACHICEMACSLARTGECNPAKSRIRILRGEMKETPVVCRQCEVMFCAAACARGAIHRSPDTGAVVVDEALCTGCRDCQDACPYGAVSFDADRRRALICDHCGGRPECVDWCPRGALSYVPADAGSRSEKAAGAEKMFAVIRQIRPKARS